MPGKRSRPALSVFVVVAVVAVVVAVAAAVFVVVYECLRWVKSIGQNVIIFVYKNI